MFIVNIAEKTCTCNFWQLVGIPCKHACAAISYKQHKPEDYVDACYTRYAYELAYGHGISAINGQDMWPVVEFGDMLPPSYKRGPGRPRKLRRRQPDEPQPPNQAEKLRRQGTKYRCTKCNEIGHNSRGCKSTVINADAQKRKRKASAHGVAGKDAGNSGNVAGHVAGDVAQDAGNVAGDGSQDVAASAGSVAQSVAADAVVQEALGSAGSVAQSVAAASAGSATIRVQKLPIISQRPMDGAPVQLEAKKGKKTLGLKKTRFSTRLKRTVLTPTGSGSNPNKPLIVEDEEE